MSKKILIVDDDKDILEPLSLILFEEGYRVEAVNKGEETYIRIDTFKPDLVLLDILMSGSDGRTICKNLKSNTIYKHIPIIMMSAHPSAKFESTHVGANDFIAKPFEIDELLNIVKKNI